MSHDIEWSTQEYSVRDVIYSHADRLPLIVQVTDGYCSNDYFHDFGAEQILRVYDVVRQERVVVRDSGGRYLSIPCSYPERVRITYRDGERGFTKEAPMSVVTRVIRKQTRGTFTLLFANDRSLETRHRHHGEQPTSNFGDLQPFNVYNEPYLLAHTVINGHELSKNTIYIPAYVPIAMTVAIGLEDGTREEFGKVLTDFKFSAARCRHDCVAGRQEVIVFPQTPGESDYEFIVPVMHIDVARSDDWQTDYAGYMKSMSPLPRKRMTKKDAYDDILTPATGPRPTRQSPATRHPRTHTAPTPPPVPARTPTVKNSTPARNTAPRATYPANSILAVVADIQRFSVKDDSKRRATERTPIAAISPQPTVPLGTSGGATRTPESSQVTQTRSVLPAGKTDRTKAVLPPSRPKDGQTRGCVNLTGSTVNVFDDHEDDILSRDVRRLSTEEVCTCLTRLKMTEHIDGFADKEVDGELLACLDEAILVNEFGFSRFNAKKLMKFVTEGYIPRTGIQRSANVSDA